jgi:dolichol-phosphate mannosyltransferase
VVPTYNESSCIKELLATLCELLDVTLPGAYEIVVVDDDSPDRTWELVQHLQSYYPAIKSVRRQGERGLATAVLTGWQASCGEILGAIDGDLQHPPQILLELLDAIRSGMDLAIASRNVDGGGVSEWSLARRMVSRGAQVLGLLVLPGIVGRVNDPLSGYFLVRRSAIATQSLQPVGYKILLEVLARGRIGPICEVGYIFQERQQGKSKVTWTHYLEYLLHLGRLRLLLWPTDRFLCFGLVGLSGTVVDMAALFLLHDPAFLALPLVPSKILAAELAILNNFALNDRWTFADKTRQQRRRRQVLKRLLKFNLICLMGLLLNLGILNLLTRGFDLYYLLANAIAIATVTLWNFWLNLKLNWRVTETQ